MRVISKWDVFLRHSVLYNRPSLFPLKIAPFDWGSGPPSNTWFLGPCPVHDPNKQYLDQFSHFCRAYYCDRQNDRPTDHATRSVTVGCIYIHSTAMRHNNNDFFSVFQAMPSVPWLCWLGMGKSFQLVKTGWWGAGVVICSNVQVICIWSSWCHCHVLITEVVSEKRQLNGCLSFQAIQSSSWNKDFSYWYHQRRLKCCLFIAFYSSQCCHLAAVDSFVTTTDCVCASQVFVMFSVCDITHSWHFQTTFTRRAQFHRSSWQQKWRRTHSHTFALLALIWLQRASKSVPICNMQR